MTSFEVAPDAEFSDTTFIELLEPDLAHIHRLARMLGGSRTAAEDLVADSIAAALPRWRAGRVDMPGAYVRRVMVHHASRRWRRAALGRRRDHRALDWLPSAGFGEADVVERDRTIRAVMQLPARRRAVVVLRFYEDRSTSEIAATLGIAEGTVKSQLSRALEQLRADLGTLEGHDERS